MSRKIRSESDLRKQVEGILKTPIADAVWRYAVNDRMVSEVMGGDNNPQWLATKVQELMEIAGNQAGVVPEFMPSERRQRRGETTQGRQEAISSALAEIARQSEDVLRFRRSVLNGQLLRFEDVENWIHEQRSKEKYRNAVIVRLERDRRFQRQNGWQVEPALSSIGPEQIEGLAPVDDLAYASKDRKWACVPIGRDGALRVTWQLSRSLAKTFRWQEAQATMFLLTGITPLVATEDVQVDRPFWVTPPYGGIMPLSCLTRVILTIDPMMTPRELSQEYGRIRAQLLGRKPRAQSEKHLQLAVFAVKHHILDKDAMAQWSARFPEWKYTRFSLFSRDAQIARERLLHEHPVDPWRKPHD